jgi:hypothetical protein
MADNPDLEVVECEAVVAFALVFFCVLLVGASVGITQWCENGH